MGQYAQALWSRRDGAQEHPGWSCFKSPHVSLGYIKIVAGKNKAKKLLDFKFWTGKHQYLSSPCPVSVKCIIICLDRNVSTGKEEIIFIRFWCKEVRCRLLLMASFHVHHFSHFFICWYLSPIFPFSFFCLTLFFNRLSDPQTFWNWNVPLYTLCQRVTYLIFKG